MPSERPLIVSRGTGLMMQIECSSKQVDFREPRDRYSVSTLKLGESQLAPRLRTIRISKPEFFRRGRDPNETRAQQSTEHVDETNQRASPSCEPPK